MASTELLKKDPPPFGLPGILSVAHMPAMGLWGSEPSVIM